MNRHSRQLLLLVELIQHRLNHRLVEIWRNLFVVILKQVIYGNVTSGNSVRRNFGSRRPDDRVKDELPELIVAPVPVNVSAAGSKAASAVRSFASPCHVLWLFPFENSFPNFRIAAMRSIAPAE